MRFSRNLELKGALILGTGNLIFHTEFPQHSGGFRNFNILGFSFLGLYSEVSLISGGNYSLLLGTIVSEVIH